MPGFEGPIYVALRPSASLAHVLLAAHAAAVAAIAFLFPVILPQLALIAAIGFNGAASLWTLRRRRPNDVTALLLTIHDGWQVSLRDGRQIGASLAATALCHAQNYRVATQARRWNRQARGPVTRRYRSRRVQTSAGSLAV